jgi:hypothetical protein
MTNRFDAHDRTQAGHPTLRFSRRKGRRRFSTTFLANRDGLKVAVIVNDMSEVNVDAQLMKNGGASLSHVDERFVEMQNG